MRFISLGHLKFGLDDLLASRAQVLTGTHCWAMYQPILQAQQQKIAALPESLRRKRPLTEELRLLNVRHDLSGSALWHLCKAIEEFPLSSETQIAAAKRVRAALVPARKVLSATYPEQAAAAALNRTKLSALEPDLKLLPMPDNKTAYDIAQVNVEAGEHQGMALGDRVTAEATESLRQEAKDIRMQCIKFLGNLRQALQDEVETNPALPRQLEALVFALLDELEEQSAKSSKAEDEDEDEEPETPPVK